MFEHLPVYASDPILGMMDEFARDPRANKVNLSIGIYYDEQGRVPLLSSIQNASSRLAVMRQPRTYLPIEGNSAYRNAVRDLLFGDDAETGGRRIAVVQTVGGSGALKVGADFLKRAYESSSVWVPNPTWDNHIGIFQGAGFEVQRYPYYISETHRFDFEGAKATLDELPERSIVVLHPCCHNPTGVQPDRAQWMGMLDIIQERELIPFLDIAYQGFGESLDDDAWLIRECARRKLEFLVASSFSKSFSLYGERVGALSVFTMEESYEQVLGQLKLNIRRNYSSPPFYGAALVAHVLSDAVLVAQWRGELNAMRERIIAMRAALVKGLVERVPSCDFSFLANQQGMFAYTGLSPQQIVRLKKKHAIYAVENGRICVAGLNSENLPLVCDAVAEVAPLY
ncbi:aromatic amino acid transaminase [Pseudomonas boanensis]|uniref:amino acid aminotransferase n=1 Tax=Metapseudomonas boanensis TaxID=2822138 RepID=UPI0035D49148